VATGLGGPSGLEDSPIQSSRAKTGNAWSPGSDQINICLKKTKIAGNRGGDRFG